MFSKIKQLPKKARTARKSIAVSEEALIPTESVIPAKGLPPRKRGAGIQSKKQPFHLLLTYFRKGKINKFCIAGEGEAKELDFMSSAKLLESKENTPRKPLPGDFFRKLQKNKEKFLSLTSEEDQPFAPSRSGRDSGAQLLKILKIIQKDMRQFTEEQEDYVRKAMSRLEEGALPKKTVKTALKAVKKKLRENSPPKPLKILAVLQKHIPDELLKKHILENSAVSDSPREVILSEYLIGEQQGEKNK